MLELSLNANLSDGVSELNQLHTVTSMMMFLKHPRDEFILYPPDSDNAIVIGVDQFTFQHDTRFLYTLRVEDADGKVVGNHDYYFALTDINELIAFALTLMRDGGEKELTNKECGWLFNKHTAVTRTVHRVAHGSRRIYAISAFRTLQQQQWAVLSQQGKRLYDESIAIEAQFERASSVIVNEERIPQHHAFYMLFEDRLMHPGEEREYTFQRYRLEFENRLDTADLQKLEHIDLEWTNYWRQFFAGH